MLSQRVFSQDSLILFASLMPLTHNLNLQPKKLLPGQRQNILVTDAAS